MTIMAVDPGNVQSGWIVCCGPDEISGSGVMDNVQMLEWILDGGTPGFSGLDDIPAAELLAIEMMRPRGQPVSRESMATLIWIGRFIQAWAPRRHKLIEREEVKMNICGRTNVKDPNVRQALIDRFGGDTVAIGGKKCRRCKGKGWFGPGRPTCGECSGHGWYVRPGPLHGISGHSWPALGVAMTFYYQNHEPEDGLCEDITRKAHPS